MHIFNNNIWIFISLGATFISASYMLLLKEIGNKIIKYDKLI